MHGRFVLTSAKRVGTLAIVGVPIITKLQRVKLSVLLNVLPIGIQEKARSPSVRLIRGNILWDRHKSIRRQKLNSQQGGYGTMTNLWAKVPLIAFAFVALSGVFNEASALENCTDKCETGYKNCIAWCLDHNKTYKSRMKCD